MSNSNKKISARLHMTADLAKQGRLVEVLPRGVVLVALGGYTEGMEDKAKAVDDALGMACLKADLVIVPDIYGRLRFVPAEDVERMAAEYKLRNAPKNTDV